MKPAHRLNLRCLILLLLLAANTTGPASGVTNLASDPPKPGLPYVYTRWNQITARDGLANDHVFAIRADPVRDCIWIGHEAGLSRYDKASREIRNWSEADGLPWRVVTGIEVDSKTGDLWLGLFGGGLARFSAGRFTHFDQLNSGLVNDVVYAVALEGDHVWAATTAGASRYNTKTGRWDMYTEKNSPMEEIWNYNVCARDGKVHLAVWGGGVLEFDVPTESWKAYVDPDGEMEVVVYRDDGIVHVITTGASYIDGILWVSSYFGCCRYDGRHWRGYFDHDCGLPSNFNNNLKARSAHECWFASDKGLGACMDSESDTWVAYTSNGANRTGTAVIQRGAEILHSVDTGYSVPHNFVICVDFDGPDVWVGTSKGVGHGIGLDYYPQLLVPASPGPEPTLSSPNPPTHNNPQSP
jgi:ligand-binding sensor domain-containing protein